MKAYSQAPPSARCTPSEAVPVPTQPIYRLAAEFSPGAAPRAEGVAQRAVEVEQQEREAREKPRVQIQTRLEPKKECRLKNETKNFVED